MSASHTAQRRLEEGKISPACPSPAERGGHDPHGRLGLKGVQSQGAGRRCAPRAGPAARGRCGPGAAASRGPAVPRSSRRRQGPHPQPQSHPVSTQSFPRPCSPAASAALGVAWLGAPSGGDRWRRVTMATRGVRCGLTPPPRDTHLRASPEKQRRRKRREAGCRARSSGSGWGGNARAAVQIRRWSSLRCASVHQISGPPSLPSASAPLRSVATQPCLLQTAVVNRCRARFQPGAQPIAALPRGASGPRRRGGQAGACADRRLGCAGRLGEVRTLLDGQAPGRRSKDWLDPGEERARGLRETRSLDAVTVCPKIA